MAMQSQNSAGFVSKTAYTYTLYISDSDYLASFTVSK